MKKGIVKLTAVLLSAILFTSTSIVNLVPVRTPIIRTAAVNNSPIPIDDVDVHNH
jgi:hypothetical protein